MTPKKRNNLLVCDLNVLHISLPKLDRGNISSWFSGNSEAKYFMCTDNSWWIMNKWKYGHYQELMANMTDVFQLQELEPKDSHNLKNREIVYTRNKPICPFYFFDDVTSTVFRWRHFYCFSMTSYLYCFSMTSYFYCFQKDLFICYVMLIASKYLFF